jgi:MFS family permease
MAAMASLNVALPDIARDTHATQTQLVWRLALAVALLVGFVLLELRLGHPLLDPRVFVHRTLSAGSTSIFIEFFAFYGFTFIILQYLQLVRGAEPLLAAVQMLPLAATIMPTARLTPKLVARAGAKHVCVAGLVLVAAGLGILAQLNTQSSYLLMVGSLIVLGVGMGAAMTPATSAITEALPASQQGIGSALNDLSREVGGATGIAVLGSILTATYKAHVNLSGLPGSVAATVRSSYAIASHLPRRCPTAPHRICQRDARGAPIGGRGRTRGRGHVTGLLRRPQPAIVNEPAPTGDPTLVGGHYPPTSAHEQPGGETAAWRAAPTADMKRS